MSPDEWAENNIGREMIDEELNRINKRIEKLEKQFEEIHGSLQQTLLDVRSTLTEMENPFNYLKEIGIDEIIQKIIEGHAGEELKRVRMEKTASMEKGGGDNQQPQSTSPPPRPSVGREEVPRSAIQHRDEELFAGRKPKLRLETLATTPYVLNLMICTEYLTQLFGRDLERILDFYESEGWIPPHIRDAVVKTAKRLFEVYSDLYILQDERPAQSVKTHIVAIYLLNKLCEENTLEFVITLLLLNWRFQPQLREGFPPRGNMRGEDFIGV